jgi:hypothetical protein
MAPSTPPAIVTLLALPRIHFICRAEIFNMRLPVRHTARATEMANRCVLRMGRVWTIALDLYSAPSFLAKRLPDSG